MNDLNEAFSAMIDTITSNRTTIEGTKLQYFNLIDVGTITSVNEGRCSVESFRFEHGVNIVYTDLELVYPGGTGNINPSGMACIVIFPSVTVDLDKQEMSTTKPYFSMFGGKVIPVCTVSDSTVKVGPDGENFSVSSEGLNITVSNNTLSISVDTEASLGASLTLLINKDGVAASLNNGNVLYKYDAVTSAVIKAQMNQNTPFILEKITGSEHWIGHVGYKAMSHTDINYDISLYQKTDFNFVEYYISTERWLYIYKNDGTVLCAIGIDNTGIIDITTNENVSLETKKDVVVNRDGTKLEVKNGKVVVTGDLEVSGKATISGTTTVTGMKTDVQNFFDGLTSALNSMFTIGSPATHQTDGGFKANIAILRGKL